MEKKAGYKLWDILTDWLKLLIKSVVPDGISCCCCSAPGSVEATVILLGEDVYKYALPSLFLFHFVTKLSPSITILQLTNCRWKGGGEGKHCGRGTLQEHWLCRLTQRRHTRTMKLNRNSPGMTIHTYTHSQGLEKIRKTSSHSSTVPLSSLAPFRIVFTYIAWPAVSSSWSSPYNPPPSFYCAPVGLAQGRKGLSCRWNELWVKK